MVLGPDDERVLLQNGLVALDAHSAGREEAIAQAAALLIAAGAVEPAFEASMQAREISAGTYLANGVAIPHGAGEDDQLIRRDAIAVVQVRDGVAWGGQRTVRLVIAIAVRSDRHLGILARLTGLAGDRAKVDRLAATSDPGEIVSALAADPVLGSLSTGSDPTGASDPDLHHRLEWTLDYPSGLHARPAARWVEAARGAGRPIRVRTGGRAADPSRLASLLNLGIAPGSVLVLSSDGPGGLAVLERFRDTIAALSAEERAQSEMRATVRPETGRHAWKRPGNGPVLEGLPAAPGLAIARARLVRRRPVELADQTAPLSTSAAAVASAVAQTKFKLAALADDARRRLGPNEGAIFEGQAGLLEDPDLIGAACRLLMTGQGAARAWAGAFEAQARDLEGAGNPVLAARAADLRDVGGRVLGVLDPATARRDPLEGTNQEDIILIAEDLAPSDTVTLDPARVLGFATAHGSPTAHTAILARTLGMPAVVALGQAALDRIGDGLVILDGDGGRLHLDPDEADLASARQAIGNRAASARAQSRAHGLPAATRDGYAIEILANVNLPEQAAAAIAQGADGVGLMRTEFLFLERGHTPTEAEQEATYRAMLTALQGKRLIVRALDIGGDKRVPHLILPQEDNPFLGVRGARLLLRRPDLLEPQLRALYRAAVQAPTRLSIMFPMVTTLAELRALREACEAARLSVAGPPVPVGIMVEVPAAALESRTLADASDFFSIGTNDLTQYTLAIDRQNPVLAAEADPLSPAVLRLIGATVAGAEARGRPVGVCGGLAGDPFGAVLLSGLGVDELSMTPRDIPGVKERLRRGSIASFREIARRALDAASADEVRSLDARDLAEAGQSA